MMFEIDENDIPLLRTGAAVLILDVQNDIVAPDGILQVNQPSDFMANISNLIPVFRSWGQIIWIGSQFERHRAINDGSVDAETVITDKELPVPAGGREARQRKRMSDLLAKLRARHRDDSDEDAGDETEVLELDEDKEGEKKNEEEEEVNEAFLTLGINQDPKCCIPMSLGVNFHSSFMQGSHNGVNSRTDLFVGKSNYSAFKSGMLIQKLRSSMVTELFICGALTNISIFATVLDAVRHGYSITIISDCCGYKSHARHSEAMRQMTESLGCETMTSLEIIEDIKDRAREREEARERSRAQNEQRERIKHIKGKKKVTEKKADAELDDLMGKLELREEEKENNVAAPPFRPSPETIRSHLWSVKPHFQRKSSIDRTTPSTPESVSPSLPRRDVAANKPRVKSKVSARRPTSKSKPKDEPPATTTLPKQSKQETTSNAKVENQTNIEIPNLAKLSIGGGMPSAEQKPVVQSKKTTTESQVKSSNPAEKEPVVQSKKTTMEPKVKSSSHSSFFCEGDSKVIYNILPEPLVDHIFQNLCREVIWQRMSHQGGEVPRLVAVQGLIFPNGTHPVYRHPSDESPPLYAFSETVRQIIPHVESALGHTVNHVLIQFYRDGTDHITEHSDKTLDIVPETFIANVSIGAQRTMTFRTKKPIPSPNQHVPEMDKLPKKTATTTDATKPRDYSNSCPALRKDSLTTEPNPRTIHKEILPHNSLCKLGLKSNAIWLHGIRPDKRLSSEKPPEVLAFNGSRISLTFRKIGTFLNRNQTLIWGQGAISKDEKNAREVVSGDCEATKEMLKAFGRENKLGGEFDWKAEYGGGFDVLHFRNERKLVLGGGDGVGDLRVRILLRELGVDIDIVGEMDLMRPIRLDADGKEVIGNHEGQTRKITFVDNDAKRSRVEGDIAILLYLDHVYNNNRLTGGKVDSACFDVGKCFTRLCLFQASGKPLESMREELSLWESFILEYGSEGYVAGTGISLVDYVFWPVLYHLLGRFEESKVLKGYYERVGKRDSVRWVDEVVSDSD